MLKNLHIKNYALIQKIDLDFQSGMTIITGETGAGKSIMLGGLELVMGKRAQQGLLKNQEIKSVVEASFEIGNYELKHLFEREDLDYEDHSIIRRELLPNGKSRAFVNDTPLRLESLTKLTENLIDIHSQHQTLALNQKEFQFSLIDALANNMEVIKQYKEDYNQYIKLQEQYQTALSKLENSKKELEYKSFQLEELKSVKLEEINQDELELHLKKLDHIEEIKLTLGETILRLDAEETGILEALVQIRNSFSKISDFDNAYREISERLESSLLELQDIAQEISSLSEKNDFDPSEKESLQETLNQLNILMIKHKVAHTEELIELRDALEHDVTDLTFLEENIEKTKQHIDVLEKKMMQKSEVIYQNRLKAIPKLVEQVENILSRLSMKDTKLRIEIRHLEKFLPNGKDILDFQISSDGGKRFGNIKQFASGGELSRIMLAVKTVLSKYKKLPTIIFDEIDAGISGDVAQNMAEVLKELSRNMQLIVITHLPQIAVMGNRHFKVYKTKFKDEIETNVKLLSKEERIYEIAEMLEGKPPSDSALRHAKHLLKL